MKKISITFAVLCMAGATFGQGSLTPPSAPAPTMKTLAELDAAIGAMSNAMAQTGADLNGAISDLGNAVEQIQDDPRTPLVAGSPGVAVYTSGTIVINQSGSYYLTTNLTVTSGDGIRIAVSGVTVDLQGFTIRSTVATPANEGIDIDKGHVSIFNGHIESGTIYDSGTSGDQYTGSGFYYGIYASLSSSSSIHIRDISVSGCDIDGIYIASADSIVESCTVEVVGNKGIKAGIVNNCSVATCGSTAIYGTQIEGCRGSSTGDDGIYSSGTVANSYGYTSSTSTDADGIDASGTVQNSYGYSSGGYGIQSHGTVANSFGSTSSTSASAYGILAYKTVQNSYGSAEKGDGIHSYGIVQNSYGVSTGNDGIYSQGTVANSYGYTSGTATYADGILASKSVKNSYGYSEGGDGIRARIVSYSYGVGGSDASADGIEAYIATSCYIIGGENITHKYNMP